MLLPEVSSQLQIDNDAAHSIGSIPKALGAIGERPKSPTSTATCLSNALANTGPPLGDLSRCSPCIVAPLATPEPKRALCQIVRSCNASDEEWNVIKTVRRNTSALLATTDDMPHAFAKALLLVRQVASPADPESGVAKALRPLETSLAEAVGKRAHKMALHQHWLNKDGPRAEFLRGCELQLEVPMTPRLRSRMLLTYHKIYGSGEKVGGALFNSKSHIHFLRKGYKRLARNTEQRASCEQKPSDPEAEAVHKAKKNKNMKEKKKEKAKCKQNIAIYDRGLSQPYFQNQGWYGAADWNSAAAWYQYWYGNDSLVC
jgi:hypothetical protein